MVYVANAADNAVFILIKLEIKITIFQIVSRVNPRNKINNGSQARDGAQIIAAKKGMNIRRKVALMPITIPNAKEITKDKIKAGNIFKKLFNNNSINIPLRTIPKKAKKVSLGEGSNHAGII